MQVLLLKLFSSPDASLTFFAIANQLAGFPISWLASVEDFFNVYIYFKCIYICKYKRLFIKICLSSLLSKVTLFVTLKTSWRHLQDMSSRRLQDMSSRRLQDVLSVTIFLHPRHFQDIFKTSCKAKNCYAEDVLKTSSRDVLKTSSRCLEDQQMLAGILQFNEYQLYYDKGNLSQLKNFGNWFCQFP